MDAIEFTAEYQAEFVAGERHYYKLAMEYHDRTEAYDQRVCSRKTTRGIAVPYSGQERQLVNRNAKMVFQDIANREGLQMQEFLEFRRAIVDAGRDFERTFPAPAESTEK